MKKIKTRQELVWSRLYEFKLDKPAIDATMSKVDFNILVKAVNSTRLNKPYDLIWLKAKIKEYRNLTVGLNRVPAQIESPITPEKYKELKKRLDERVKHIIN